MNAQRRTVRRIAVGLAVAATLATSACAAGQRSETSEELPTLDGINADVGKVALRGLAVLTPDAATYPKGSNPQLRLVIVNNGPSTDQLTSVSSSISTGWGSYANQILFDDDASPAPDATSTATPSTAGNPVTLTKGVRVSFGVPDADGRILALLKTTKTLYPGTEIAIHFTFAKAGSTTVEVPIQSSASGSYTPSPSYIPSPADTDADIAGQEEGR